MPVEVEDVADEAAEREGERDHDDAAALGHALDGDEDDGEALALDEEVAEVVGDVALEEQADDASDEGLEGVEQGTEQYHGNSFGWRQGRGDATRRRIYLLWLRAEGLAVACREFRPRAAGAKRQRRRASRA